MPIWDPSTLAFLSAPGFNRAIGQGDVVPYWGQQPNQTAGGAGVATPGVTYDPNALAGLTSPTAGGGAGDSILNNLSALTPILDKIIQQQQQAAIPSGQGNAQANPLPGAVPGASSQSVASQAAIGGIPIAGAPAPGGLSTPSGSPAADAGPAPTGGDAGAAPAGAPGTAGVAGNAGDASGGQAADTGGAPSAPSAPSASEAGIAAGEGGVGISDGGGGGAPGGAGGTILVTYTLRHIPVNKRRAIGFWMRVRDNFRATPEGESTYQYYQKTGSRIIEQIERLPEDEKHRVLGQMHTFLVAPFTRRARAEDTRLAANHLLLVVAGLIYTLKMDVVEA